MPESAFPADAVSVVRGEPAGPALTGSGGGFLARGGTARTYEPRLSGNARRARPTSGRVEAACYLLPPGRFEPEFHMNCQFAVRPGEDSLPHFKASTVWGF